jgi:hypothetical protein
MIANLHDLLYLVCTQMICSETALPGCLRMRPTVVRKKGQGRSTGQTFSPDKNVLADGLAETRPE